MATRTPDSHTEVDAKEYARAEKAVARGVELLNRKRPGWAQTEKVKTLDLGDTCHCVLGQNFTKEFEALTNREQYNINSPFTLGVMKLRLGNPAKYGFDIHSRFCSDYETLRILWAKAIREQRKADREAAITAAHHPAS